MFGAIELTTNPDWEKDLYSVYGIPNFDWDKDVTTFGVDHSSSMHINNTKKYILTLGEVPTQGLDDSAITVEAKYFINFTRSKYRF